MSDKELEIHLSEQVKAKIDSDPEIATAMREVMANMHQAHQAVKDGRYKSFDEAMEAITGDKPRPVGPIEASWAHFAQTMIEPSVSQKQLNMIRATFYAGVNAMMTMIRNGVEYDDIAADMSAYIDDLKEEE